jgi:PAS domain S-box-containing protein
MQVRSSSSQSRQSRFRSSPAEAVSPAGNRQARRGPAPSLGAGGGDDPAEPRTDSPESRRISADDEKPALRISWLAVLVLIGSLAGTLVVWSFVRANERSHVQRMTSLAASAIHADIESDMQTWVRGLVRLAKTWEFGGTPREWSTFASIYQRWFAFSDLYIEHHPGCLAIEWLDPKYAEHWLVRPKGAKPVPLAGAEIRDVLLRSAEKSGTPIISPILVSSQGRKQWLVVVPIYRNADFRGFVLGFFDVQQTLDGMLEDVSGLGFSAALQQGGLEIYRLPGSTSDNEQEWARTVDVALPATEWRLRAWPRPEGMAELRSRLPLVTLLSGLSLSLLLTLTVQTNQELRRGIAERRRAERALAASQARFAGILEISADAVISMNQNHRITLYNQAAQGIFGYSAQEVIGKTIDVLIPERFREVHRQHVAEFAKSARHNLRMTERRPVSGLRKDGSEFPMNASVSKLELDGEKIFTIICGDVTRQVKAEEALRHAHDELERRVHERTADLERANLALHEEITERKLAEEEVRTLSARVMRVQDEERRHLARELHDGTTQNLVAITLNLATARDAPRNDAAAHGRLEESLRLAEQCANELRTISYLLHPPLLEELGLGRTLRGYVEGFSKRSGIAVTLHSPPELGRLGFEVELTIFRIVQEALANVHRHSQSRTAAITLAIEEGGIALEVADQGRGMQQEAISAGVGIAGMRERVRLLKGRFEIASNSNGTTIKAFLPLA